MGWMMIPALSADADGGEKPSKEGRGRTAGCDAASR